MRSRKLSQNSNDYWKKAGEVGYENTYFRNKLVSNHILGKSWKTAIDIANDIGATSSDCVLDLGCGDGSFANTILAKHFRTVYGFDKSVSAIARSKMNAQTNNVHFEVVDLLDLDFDRWGSLNYGCAFLIGILHHVKSVAPSIVSRMVKIAPRVVVIEPNGKHLLRKLLELTPSYRAAGEESFSFTQISNIFRQSGYELKFHRRFNLFPNRIPESIFCLLLPWEHYFEERQWLRHFLTADGYGFIAKNSP